MSRKHRNNLNILSTFAIVAYILFLTGNESYLHAQQVQLKEKAEAVSECQKNLDPNSLKSIMCDLGHAMNYLQMGVWSNNAKIVAKQARKIADHPQVSPSEKKRISAELGDKFGEFVAFDRAVHAQAVKLEELAKSSSDQKLWLKQMQQLQNGCMACHLSFRDPLRRK